MAKNKKKKDTQNEFLENPEAVADQLSSKTEEFIEANKGLVLGLSAVIILIVGGYFGYNYYVDAQNSKAQSEMFQAIYYFESDSLELALNGDGINFGFKDIIDQYAMTDAANLANYYAGAAFLKQGDFKSALLYLEDFKANDLLVQGRAYSLMGDAYMELKDYANAAKFFEKAANYEENKFFTPKYLMKAALAYEYDNNMAAAKESYDTVIKKYWGSSEVQFAKKYKARLDKSAS